MSEYAVSMRDITKTFGEVVANENACLDIRRGEILSILGENGSGKTTLMNMLSGIYFPDGGKIFVGGEEVSIKSPTDAFKLGIGMVHQHFKLIDIFTAAENIILGLKDSKFFIDKKKINEQIKKICDKYGFVMNPSQKVYEMSVSQKQTLEIIKVLFRGVDILILDEPTAVLTPQETKNLFSVIRNMRADGKSVVIITHKLHEIFEISDRVTILRKGSVIDSVDIKDATPASLTEMMVGGKVDLNIERPEPAELVKKLEISNLNVMSADGLPALTDVSFDIFGGEVLGIAGISGCGQKELLEAIAGLQPTLPGSSIKFYKEEDFPTEISGMSPRKIREMGVQLSFVPEDRLGMGLVGSMDLAENMMLKSYSGQKSLTLDKKAPEQLAEKTIRELQIATPGVNTQVRKLSGGNIQKVLVGREISESPTVLLTAYIVRGLDVNTSLTIYKLLNEQKARGVAVVYVGEDLDVLLALSDRILVLCGGHINGVLDGRKTTKEEVGYLMTHLDRKEGGE